MDAKKILKEAEVSARSQAKEMKAESHYPALAGILSFEVNKLCDKLNEFQTDEIRVGLFLLESAFNSIAEQFTAVEHDYVSEVIRLVGEMSGSTDQRYSAWRNHKSGRLELTDEEMIAPEYIYQKGKKELY